MIQDEILFKGWGVDVEFLETLVAMCKKYGKEEVRIGVAGLSSVQATEFIDPAEPGSYDFERYKLFIRGVSFASTGFILSTVLDPNATFDDFPPIPPEPIQDPG
ncbi:MAG TPA: hypothetical protein VLA34_02140 [Candidatus Krumholzibacterium sp.]|nr:hypothetical protein [Candidatus Krumholzibacterium sp.]